MQDTEHRTRNPNPNPEPEPEPDSPQDPLHSRSVPPSVPERLSIELTNRCDKACSFCYAGSHADGATEWTVDQLVALVTGAAAAGTRACSFGGGEPLQYSGLFELLGALHGVVFRSFTTNGLLLDDRFDRVLAAAPDKVHISLHFPGSASERRRVIRQVVALQSAGVTSGVNLLVRASQLEATIEAAAELRASGIDNQRIVYLPMRGHDTPTAKQVARVAGGGPFQSMTCLPGCAKSRRFAAISWDKRIAWCSYTTSRRELPSLDAAGIRRALTDLDLAFCGPAPQLVSLGRRASVTQH